jgi:Domain of unknown function (DUF6089)
MKKLKIGLAVILVLFSVSKSISQSIEFGLMLGGSNYYGDLSNNSVMLSQTHPSASIIGRYNINDKWAVKGNLGYGRISGDDALGSSAFRKARNLSFYSDIYEFSAQVEFNLLKNTRGKNKLIPYVFTGIGVFNFNPKAKLGSTYYELQPLGTEGQGTTLYNDRQKYALTTLCIPLGFGLKQKVSERFTIGFEVGVRFTFTNYLDDVSSTYADPRVIRAAYGTIAAQLSDRSGEKTADGSNVFAEGDPRGFKSLNILGIKINNFSDMYFMSGLSVSYVLKNKGQGCPKF